jgi:hypothetical protein
MSTGESHSVERALGDIAIISEKSVTHVAPKLTVSLHSDEFLFMLATFCFDLSRRMDYLWKATKGFAGQAGQELAREVLKDNEAINAPGLPWKERAERAEQIMLRLAAQIGKEHDRAMRDAAR